MVNVERVIKKVSWLAVKSVACSTFLCVCVCVLDREERHNVMIKNIYTSRSQGEGEV